MKKHTAKHKLAHFATMLFVFGTLYSLYTSQRLISIHLQAYIEAIFPTLDQQYYNTMNYEDVQCPLGMAHDGAGQVSFTRDGAPYTFIIEQGACLADTPACSTAIRSRSGGMDALFVYDNNRPLCSMPLVGLSGWSWRQSSGLIMLPGLFSVGIGSSLWLYAAPPRKKKRSWSVRPVRLRTVMGFVMVVSMIHPIIVPVNVGMYVLFAASGMTAIWLALVGIRAVLRFIDRARLSPDYMSASIIPLDRDQSWP
ncbi:MAG: hypothetical protein JXA10_10840 [Anaerolineae bacterium]|nr:hypothetical protein [Anaerolineae bacterium]